MSSPQTKRTVTGADLASRGEPYLWSMGGALALGLIMIFGFLALVAWNGFVTFYPKPVEVLRLKDGSLVAGEPTRSEMYRLPKNELDSLEEKARQAVQAHHGFGLRTLYRTGNFDLYNEDFVWISEFRIAERSTPKEFFFIERLEWGPFIGTMEALKVKGENLAAGAFTLARLEEEHRKALERRNRVRAIERNEMGAINRELDRMRLALRRMALEKGNDSPEIQAEEKKQKLRAAQLQTRYGLLQKEAESIKREDSLHSVVLKDIRGTEKTLALSQIVRFYPANDLSFFQKVKVYGSRWLEFLTAEPREANTEGGVLPAIFGTFVMTVLLAVAVAPFGVMAALYLREYAKQGRLVSLVRICVNNLAGVPSIVYGVFGLGFFAYILGGTIDQIFFAERLPNPTFGTGGLLWASLTLAMLTVPVVIVSTEEALAAVPQSMREGSLACGASKWQTIKNIVLPKAMPGIMTGLILAMARGAGEVAPLMLVGVVKIAPSLPLDEFFPFLHLERSFMHLGFHIYDVGFQSRNSEAGKPMVFVTTLLLIGLVAVMNATAIYIRNRLKRKYYVGHF
ncbi:MAG: phosphate ABC transporter permease PstA [Desulfobacterota bacterium]|nr:phosphate ABC transporter permease PstA [Thermodesulfobacteriota bacterium]